VIAKEELLARLEADRRALLDAVEGVPDEALTTSGAVGAWSAMNVLEHARQLRAWPGERERSLPGGSGRVANCPGVSPTLG
jgi:hypothetical protein